MSDQHFYLIGQAVFVVLDYVSELMLTEIVLVAGQQQDLIICIPMSTSCSQVRVPAHSHC